MDEYVAAMNHPRETGRVKPPQNKPVVSQDVQGFIGDQLRAVDANLKAEPIPDRLFELLRQMDKP
jgi:Anti-sigma factor NepR